MHTVHRIESVQISDKFEGASAVAPSMISLSDMNRVYSISIRSRSIRFIFTSGRVIQDMERYIAQVSAADLRSPIPTIHWIIGFRELCAAFLVYATLSPVVGLYSANSYNTGDNIEAISALTRPVMFTFKFRLLYSLPSESSVLLFLSRVCEICQTLATTWKGLKPSRDLQPFTLSLVFIFLT